MGSIDGDAVGTAVAVQAHRGSPDPASGIGENTLAAFDRARRLGAAGVELDVRRTADGALAVHHDPVVPGAGALHELGADSLPASVPLLEEALEACRGLVVNVEVKNLPGEAGFDPEERVAAAVARLVAALEPDRPVVVSSFWPRSLEVVREIDGGIVTGLLLTPRTASGERSRRPSPSGVGRSIPTSTSSTARWSTGRTRPGSPSRHGR